jgi:hypothetical protein
MHYKYGELCWQNYSIGGSVLCLIMTYRFVIFFRFLSRVNCSTEQNDNCFSMARRKRGKHCKSVWYPDLWQHVTTFLWSELLSLHFQLGNRPVGMRPWHSPRSWSFLAPWVIWLTFQHFGVAIVHPFLCCFACTPFQSSAYSEKLDRSYNYHVEKIE